MHANKQLYRQYLDFGGSKAEKLSLVTGFGVQGLWGAKTSSHGSPLLWANHFNVIPEDLHAKFTGMLLKCLQSALPMVSKFCSNMHRRTELDLR